MRSSTAIARVVAGSAASRLLGRQRAEQPHLEHADLLAVAIQVLDGLLRGLGTRTHEG